MSKDAFELSRSMRGQYLISQALYVAIPYVEVTDPSNAKDMKLLLEQVFPIYDAVAKIQRGEKI